MFDFKTYHKDRWDKMTMRDRQITISVALNTASSILHGSGKPVEETIKYTEEILEHFYQFPETKKPIIPKTMTDKVNEKIQTDKKEYIPF